MSLNARHAVCVLCLLQLIAGQLREPPQNVTFFSSNFMVLLKWLPGSGYPADVRYTVNYRDSIEGRWVPFPQCENISTRECNVTCLNDQYSKYEARVIALLKKHNSPWGFANTSFTYVYDVEPGPPQLKLNVSQENLMVSATLERLSCWNKVFLDPHYDIIFWGVAQDYKIKEEGHLIFDTVKISISKLKGNYCLIARTTLPSEEKQSPFTKPVCMHLNRNDPDWSVQTGVPLVLFMIVVVLGVFLFTQFKRPGDVRLPSSLVFLHEKLHLDKQVFEPGDLLLKISHMRLSDQHSQDVKYGDCSSKYYDSETTSSCRSYIKNHKLHQTEAPSEESGEAEVYPYKQLPSTLSTVSGSSPIREVVGSASSSESSTNNKDFYIADNKETEVSAEGDLLSMGFRTEELHSMLACIPHANPTNTNNAPLSTARLASAIHIGACSASNMVLVPEGDMWTNNYNAARNTEDVCPPLHISRDIAALPLNEEQINGFHVTLRTENSSLPKNPETLDWDMLLLQTETSDQSVEQGSNDDDCTQDCDVQKFQSAYMSRMC